VRRKNEHMQMKVLIIIPAYNEAENIEKVVNEIKTAAPEMDYLVINDCSKDNTEKICKENRFNYVSLPVNLGIGGGVQTGYLYALQNGYDIAVQIDGDGQHDPIYIRKVVQPIIDGEADVVIGSRFINKEGFQSSGARRFGIKFLSRLIKLCCGVQIRDVTSGYRAINSRFIQIFANNYAQDYPEPEAIIATAMNNGRVQEIPVLMKERTGGKSSISALKPFYYMLKVSLAISLYRVTFEKESGI
jgi:glycosyltransferase involved in cell wall biosynthesis